MLLALAALAAGGSGSPQRRPAGHVGEPREWQLCRGPGAHGFRVLGPAMTLKAQVQLALPGSRVQARG